MSVELELEVERLRARVVELESLQAASESKAANLTIALQSSRRIGEALGIIMDQQKLTDDDAFEYLRQLSQNTGRKVRELAEQIAETGEVPLARA